MLFRGVYFKYAEKNSATFKQISLCDLAKEFDKQSKETYPRMGTVNQVLKIHVVFQAVLADFGLNPLTVLPDFPETLLYGVLSEQLHNPDIAKVIVSDKSSNEYKKFFLVIGNFFKLPFLEFNEILSEYKNEDNRILWCCK